MNQKELKTLIYISVLLALVIGVSYMLIQDSELKIGNILRAISFGLTITTLFWTFYFTWGWKWWCLKKIFFRPNLNGTWSGELISDYKDKQGNPVGPIPFHIVIRQKFLRIHFTTFTDKFVGISYSETLYLNKNRGLKNVAYLYRKETSQNNGQTPQEGAAELRLINSDINRLEGRYWSNSKTNGTIMISFVSKCHVDSFDDAKNLNK